MSKSKKKKNTAVTVAQVGWNLCSHWQDEVIIGESVVLVSGILGHQALGGVEPDFGMYLDAGWARVVNHDLVTPGTSYGRNDGPEVWVVSWRDYSALNQRKYTQVVTTTADKIRENKLVEVGCAGAHGRTGTVLAGLLVALEKKSAKQAIEAVRDRHCESAVEIQSQQEMVFKLAGEPFKPLEDPVNDIITSIGAQSDAGWNKYFDKCPGCDHYIDFCSCDDTATVLSGLPY